MASEAGVNYIAKFTIESCDGTDPDLDDVLGSDYKKRPYNKTFSLFEKSRRDLLEKLSSIKRHHSVISRYDKYLITKVLKNSELPSDSNEISEQTCDETFGSKGYIWYFKESPKGKGIARLPGCGTPTAVDDMVKGSAFFDKDEQFEKEWKLRWIHLPASHAEWASHVMTNIFMKKMEEKTTVKTAAREVARKILKPLVHDVHRTKKANQPHGRYIRPSFYQRDVDLNNLAGEENLHSHRRSSFLAIPFLNSEYSIDCHLMNYISKFRITTDLPNAQDIALLPCTNDEKLLWFYPPKKSTLQMRRTLDQANFPSLDTSRRDTDQVVERYAEKYLSGSTKGDRIIMVDQLWLWILGDHTVFTCFPKAWERYEDNDKTVGIYEALAQYFNRDQKLECIDNVQELAYCIIDRCSSNVFDSDLTNDESLDFMEMFRRTIAIVMDEQTQLFEELSNDTERGGNFFKKGFDLLEQVKDIKDELQMMHSIQKQQKRYLGEMGKFYRNERSEYVVDYRRKHYLEDRPDEMAEHIQKLVEDANVAYDLIIHILDLKQKQMALLEAKDSGDTNIQTQKILRESHASADRLLTISTESKITSKELLKITKSSERTFTELLKLSQQSKEMADASKRGSNIILLFTVITIIFLPLSTIASLFSVNAFELNDGKLPISTVLAIIFPISITINIIALILAFNETAYELMFGSQSNQQSEENLEGDGNAESPNIEGGNGGARS